MTLTIPNDVLMQKAADDVSAIAEVMLALGLLIDNFRDSHGEKLFGEIVAAWPDAAAYYGSLSYIRLCTLEKRWTPPED